MAEFRAKTMKEEGGENWRGVLETWHERGTKRMKGGLRERWGERRTSNFECLDEGRSRAEPRRRRGFYGARLSVACRDAGAQRFFEAWGEGAERMNK